MLSSPFFRAVSLLIGTIIGAGIFGIPYVTVQAGYPVGLAWLIGLTILTLVIKFAYAKVILSFDDHHPHQLTGYGEHYFGKAGKFTAAGILLVGHWGALVAYIAGMGEFGATLLGQPDLSFWASVIVFAVGTVLILGGLRTISELESIITLLLVVMVLGLGVVGLGKINTFNLLPFSTAYILNSTSFLAPYGVIFGSLSGWAVLPEIATILKSAQPDNVKHPVFHVALRRVILVGVLTAAVVYAIFQFTVVGISGAATSEEAIRGLVPYFSPEIIRAGAVFGLLAMGTSFLTLAYSLRDMFDFDFGLKPLTAVILTMVPPFCIFLLGLRSFILAFGLTGIWIGTLSMLFIFGLYFKSKSVER